MKPTTAPSLIDTIERLAQTLNTTPTTPNNMKPTTAPLYTFQDIQGNFVDVMASASYSGDSIDLTARTTPAGIVYSIEGTTTTRTDYRGTDLAEALCAALTEFRASSLAQRARRLGAYSEAKDGRIVATSAK